MSSNCRSGRTAQLSDVSSTCGATTEMQAYHGRATAKLVNWLTAMVENLSSPIGHQHLRGSTIIMEGYNLPGVTKRGFSTIFAILGIERPILITTTSCDYTREMPETGTKGMEMFSLSFSRRRRLAKGSTAIYKMKSLEQDTSTCWL